MSLGFEIDRLCKKCLDLIMIRVIFSSGIIYKSGIGFKRQNSQIL